MFFSGEKFVEADETQLDISKLDMNLKFEDGNWDGNPYIKASYYDTNDGFGLNQLDSSKVYNDSIIEEETILKGRIKKVKCGMSDSKNKPHEQDSYLYFLNNEENQTNFKEIKGF